MWVNGELDIDDSHRNHSEVVGNTMDDKVEETGILHLAAIAQTRGLQTVDIPSVTSPYFTSTI